MLEGTRTILEAVRSLLEDMETPELVSADELMVGRDVSLCVEEDIIEVAGTDDMIVDGRTKELLVIVGTATLIGADEVVFAYGATTELARAELGAVKARLVLMVVAGTDVLNRVDEVVDEIERVTELLTKTELVGIELLVKTELIAMVLLLIAGIDVLRCAAVVIELLVTGPNTVVLVEFRRGADVTIAEDTVLLAIMDSVDIELLLGTTLLETFRGNDDEVMMGLDVVSGAVVGVQDASEAETVTVLSYVETISVEIV